MSADDRRRAIERVEERVRVAVESAPPLPADLERRCLELIRSARVTFGHGLVGEAA